MIRLLTRAGIAILVIAILAYPLDWVVWRGRMAAGSGMGTVQVSRFTVAELKGGKESYYFDGTDTVDCSHSLLPEAGAGACWWLARHAEVLQRY
jgi:hypothetical protein